MYVPVSGGLLFALPVMLFPHTHTMLTPSLRFTSPPKNHLLRGLFTRGFGDELRGQRKHQEDRLGW